MIIENQQNCDKFRKKYSLISKSILLFKSMLMTLLKFISIFSMLQKTHLESFCDFFDTNDYFMYD